MISKDVCLNSQIEVIAVKFCFNITITQWFSTFSVPWLIFQPKLTSQPNDFVQQN